MSKAATVKFNDISELPAYLSINDVMYYFSASRPTVERWFKSKNFPKVNLGFIKVNKFDLVNWLNKNSGNPQATYIEPNNFFEKLLDKLEDKIEYKEYETVKEVD